MELTRKLFGTFAVRPVLTAALGLVLAACQPVVVSPDEADDAEDAAAPAGDVAAGPVDGAPAMWSFADADTTVYLFGTVHLLKPGTEWRTAAIDAAFAASDTVYFEADITDPDLQAAALPIMTIQGTYMGAGSLTETLNDDQEREVEEAAEALGMSLASLDPLRPWVAAIQLTQVHIINEGYDPASGVERVLETEALEAGKAFGFFETPAEQLTFFAELPEADQVEFLVATAEQIEDDPQALDELVDQWAAGDVDALAEMLADPEALGSEALYDVLIVERNANWLPEIEALLDAPGVKFVAVGAGHLAGEDGLVEMLRARGYVVEGP